MKNKRKQIALLILVFLLIPLTAIAHSGNTDGSGGHRDNKNKSGLGYYHYHCGGYPPHLHNGGVCPYKGGSSSNSTYVAPAVVYATKINPVNVPTEINAGEAVTLKGEVYPANSEDSQITWESNSPEIVTITSAGELKAVGIGTAAVTAATSRGTKSTFNITVKEVFAESIQIQNKASDILIGDNKYLSVSFTPSNTTNKNISWSSDNENVASVSDKGTLTALSPGTATISAVHNELSDSFVIKVLPIEAESIHISSSDDNNTESGSPIKLKKGDILKLSATVLPHNTTDKTVKWSVSNSSIAKISSNGNLTALRTGDVTVYATASNGIKTSITIKVYSYTSLLIVSGGIFVLIICAGVWCLVKRLKK